MAHELGTTDHMFSARKIAPWHHLGTILDDSPRTSAEAIVAAKLDWEVVKRNVFAKSGESYQDISGFWAMIRQDKEHGDIPLGVVGDRYTPLQNTEAFEFFDSIVQDGVADYETAGSLRDGKKVWILAKMKGELLVGENDSVDRYVLLSNSHDGSSAVTVKVTPVRVVCANTLSAALRGAKDVKNQFNLRHTRSVADRLKQAQMTLETVSTAYEKLGRVWSKMAEVALPKHELVKYVYEVFPEKEDSKNNKRLMTLRTEILQLAEGGTGQDLFSAHETLWGAYNAVTEHVTHVRSERKNSSLDTHVDNLFYGRLSDTLDGAFDVAMKMMQDKGIEIDSL